MKTAVRICQAAVTVLALAAAAPAAEKVVARVKVHNPGKAWKLAIVRGALPIPKNFDGDIHWLALRDGKRALTTQASVLSTYPGSDADHPVGRPEVVQLATLVDLSGTTMKTFDVVLLDRHITFGQDPWIGGSRPDVTVEATDCFGNVYRASPLKQPPVQVRVTGELITEKTFQAPLTPVGEPVEGKPALKQFLHARIYLTQYSMHGFVQLAVMVHNGSIDHPNGTVYYRGIRVGVLEKWAIAVRHKRFSPAADAAENPIKEKGRAWMECPPPPEAKEKVYGMSHGMASVLRLAAYYTPSKQNRIDMLAYQQHAPIFVPVAGEGLWSWSNPATARYDSPKWPMPLSMPAGAMAKIDKDVAGRLASPTLGWDLTYLRDKGRTSKLRALGHAMPAGVAYGGMTGGQGVNYVFGARAAVTGHNGLIHLHPLLADRNWDRQRAHLFYDDGRPFTYSRHVVEDGGVKVLDMNYDSRGRFHLNIADPAAKAHADHVKAKGLLAPEAERLLKYMNHDDQHLSRVFDAVPSAYLACDPVNRDRLVTLGAQACWKLNLYPVKTMRKFGGWGSLFSALRHVDAKPHTGIGVSREWGWKTHSLGWAHDLSQDKAIRADCVAVAKADVAMRAKAQMPAGNITLRGPSGKAFGGAYWFTTGWEEGAIMADGARAVVNILSAPETESHAKRMKEVYARVGRWVATKGWNAQSHSPGFHIALRAKGAKEMLDKPIAKGGCSFYMGSPMTWYYELTGDDIFLKRLREMSGDKGLAAQSMRTLGNWSYALYLAQGGKIPGRKGWKPSP